MSDETTSPGPWHDGGGGLSRLATQATPKEYGVWASGAEIAIVHRRSDAALIADAPRLREENKAMLDLLRDIEIDADRDLWIDRVRALIDKHGRSK